MHEGENLIARGSFLSQIQMVHTLLPLQTTQIIIVNIIVLVLNIQINIKYIKSKKLYSRNIKCHNGQVSNVISNQMRGLQN